MKLPTIFKCSKCGNVVPIEQALAAPVPPDQAQPLPCAKCGNTNWVPVK
jgi:predicted nucleic-acid-binding Zn-ribbon protein